MNETQNKIARPLYYILLMAKMRLSDQLPEEDKISNKYKPAHKSPKDEQHAKDEPKFTRPLKTFYHYMRSKAKARKLNQADNAVGNRSWDRPAILLRSREIRGPDWDRERRLIIKHVERVTLAATGKTYEALDQLYNLAGAEKTQTVIESMADFKYKQLLLVEAVVAFSTSMKEHKRAPTDETAFLVARIDRYIPLLGRVLQRAMARLERACENPNVEMKRLRYRTYLLPESIRTSDLLRDDHG